MTKRQTLNERLACCASGGGIVPNRKLVADAQSRIAELEADRDKWRNECLEANESERKLFQRQAELEVEVADLKLQLGMCDHSLHAAWNDAIDAAARVVAEGFDRGINAPQDQCNHDKYRWEDCEECCIDAIRSLRR